MSTTATRPAALICQGCGQPTDRFYDAGTAGEAGGDLCMDCANMMLECDGYASERFGVLLEGFIVSCLMCMAPEDIRSTVESALSRPDLPSPADSEAELAEKRRPIVAARKARADAAAARLAAVEFDADERAELRGLPELAESEHHLAVCRRLLSRASERTQA